MGRGQSCCFCLVWGQDKAPSEKVAIHLHPPGMCFSYFRPQYSLCPFLPFCSPRGSVLVGVRVVSGIEVNEVHPPFFLCKMKATSLRGGLPPCVLAARRHLRRPFTAEHRGRWQETPARVHRQSVLPPDAKFHTFIFPLLK